MGTFFVVGLTEIIVVFSSRFVLANCRELGGLSFKNN